jgi:hypothetical protein
MLLISSSRRLIRSSLITAKSLRPPLVLGKTKVLWNGSARMLFLLGPQDSHHNENEECNDKDGRYDNANNDSAACCRCIRVCLVCHLAGEQLLTG